jgi:hypothetical protein
VREDLDQADINMDCPAGGDLRHDIVTLEDRIEALESLIQNCRKAMKISRLFIAAGAICFIATLGGAFQQYPAVLVFAIAAIVGGFVWLAANKSSLRSALGRLHASELARAGLIDQIPWRRIETSSDTAEDTDRGTASPGG